MHRSFLKLVACVTVSACARSVPPAVTPAPAPSSDVSVVPATPAPLPAAPDRNTSREFRGAYTRGFEASWFAPCDAPMDDALWWVTLTEAARLQRDSLLKTLTSAPTGALAVRWKGTISARMPAGQLGRGTRYMLVTEILEVRPLAGEGACSPASRAS